ncbi:MAG: chemotaxis protein CheA [Pseudomonadota bacterium]
MSSHFDKALELLDRIALNLIMLEPGNIPGFSVVLNNFDELSRLFVDSKNDLLTVFASTLKSIVEKILIEEITTEDGMDKVADGVSLFQEVVRNAEHGIASDKVERFLKNIAEPLAQDIPRADIAEPSANETGQASEGSVKSEGEGSGEDARQEPIQDPELLANFISESQEHLESIELNILSLEEDPENIEVINAIFRPFHTIKGVAGFLNLTVINHLAHDVESLLDDARNKKLIVNAQIIDIVLEAVDIMKTMVQQLQKDLETGFHAPAGVDIKPFIVRLKKVAITGAASTTTIASVAGWSLKADGSPGVAAIGEILIEQGAVSRADVDNAVKAQDDFFDKKIGEILIEDSKASPRDVAQALREQKKRRSEQTESGRGGGLGFIKVDTKKLDNMVDMVGELVITHAMITDSVGIVATKEQKLSRDLAQLARITSELQKISMSMRMVPIKQTFHKMMRLVRDLSKKSGKIVDLLMFGEDTEIDRNMVEEIYDPLVHMIRNSVDHGVEMPDVREVAGKPKEGTLVLKAYHKGGDIVIELIDDGKGLDQEKILKKAIDKGLVKPEESLSEQDINLLIFQPGFSTADKITDVSGRGVGMDVVKRAIDGLRGKLEVRTEKNKGTTVVMRLPLTLAIIDGILIKVGDREYIIPTVSVVESLKPDRSLCTTVAGCGEIVRIRDSILPLIRLHKIFGITPRFFDPWDAIVVVVENEGRRRCILVDELIGKHEVVIKSLGEKLKQVKGLAGGAILADGRVGLIIDPAGLFEVSES